MFMYSTYSLIQMYECQAVPVNYESNIFIMMIVMNSWINFILVFIYEFMLQNDAYEFIPIY